MELYFGTSLLGNYKGLEISDILHYCCGMARQVMLYIYIAALNTLHWTCMKALCYTHTDSATLNSKEHTYRLTTLGTFRGIALGKDDRLKMRKY